MGVPPSEPAAVVAQDELVTGQTQKEMPEAKFLDNVEQFVGSRDVVGVVGALQDLHSKYKYLESGLLSQKQSLKSKIPDIEDALQLVEFLIKKQEAAEDEASKEVSLPVTYNLSENVYVSADVPIKAPSAFDAADPSSKKKANTILLWLGANTLLEYSVAEAQELLSTNITNAKVQLASCLEDSSFVRDQIVTTEVNIARVHNYGVLQRQKVREAQKETEAEAEETK